MGRVCKRFRFKSQWDKNLPITKKRESMGAYVKKKEDDEEREQSMIVHTPSSS